MKVFLVTNEQYFGGDKIALFAKQSQAQKFVQTESVKDEFEYIIQEYEIIVGEQPNDLFVLCTEDWFGGTDRSVFLTEVEAVSYQKKQKKECLIWKIPINNLF